MSVDAATRTVFDYDHGISAVDAGYQRPMLAAVHLIVEDGRAAIVDTAHGASVPRVIAALRARDIAPEQVDYVILTHVHLDHAGAAGLLLTHLPNARVTVHPRGARHMIDPSALFAATIAVYGEERARRLYGEIVPVPAQRLIETPEGHAISLNGRELRFLDTPGHARHHVCIHDTRSGHIFAGDTFGISYRELDVDGRAMIFPSSTPVQFDPPELRRSVDRLLALEPEAVYLTHFGRVGDVRRLGADLHRLIDAHAAIALGCGERSAAQRRACLVDGVRDLLLEECRRHGCRLSDDRYAEILDHDIGLNADGLAAWLDSKR
jgi:hydroxyacylglutathione hydrolase